MEIGQLEAFERVAREGNFTRAAESLQLTQPAVSTRISLLEAELGGKLFDRRGRQLVLTPLGGRFLPYAQRILSLREAGLEAVRQFRTGVSGQVRLGAPTPLLLSYMVDALMRFRQSHPAVDLNIRERDKATIVQMIADNALTLGLVYHPVFDTSMQHLLRFRDPIVPIVGTHHPLAEQTHRILRMEDLHEHTVFRVSMFPQMSAFIDEVVEHSRQGSGGAVIAVPMVMARRLVMMGQGVTFLPSSYVRAPIESGEFVQLNISDMPSLYSEPIVIARQGRELDDAHNAFIEVLRYQWRHWLA